MVGLNPPQALTIAGSDSGGGAGIQADLKTFQMRGVFGTGAITALTAQNSLGVHAVYPVDAAFVTAQIDAVAADFAIRAVKIGMLASAQIIEVVADALAQHDMGKVVLDPVMKAKDGVSLLDDSARAVLLARLLPQTDVFTPNLPETEALCGIRVENADHARRAAAFFQEKGAKNVVIKGGHANTDECCDWVFLADSSRFSLTRPRVATRHSHGTGCTFAACIAAELAKGQSVEMAVRIAKNGVYRALAETLGIGAGQGPLNHWALQD